MYLLCFEAPEQLGEVVQHPHYGFGIGTVAEIFVRKTNQKLNTDPGGNNKCDRI